jgi:hypothetical protein
MAKKKEAGAAKKKAVKTAGSVRVRSARDIDRYFSHRETLPIDVTDELGMIREGIHPPFQYQNLTGVSPTGEPRQVGRFEKTARERSEWQKHHSNAKGPSGGGGRGIGREVKHTLVLHLKNTKHDKFFTSTRSFTVYPSEVKLVVDRYNWTKYHYRGNTVHVS